MKKNPLEKIIDTIREGMMTTQSSAGKPGFSGKADAEGPTAGYDPVMNNMMRRHGKRKHLKLPKGQRKRWKGGFVGLTTTTTW